MKTRTSITHQYRVGTEPTPSTWIYVQCLGVKHYKQTQVENLMVSHLTWPEATTELAEATRRNNGEFPPLAKCSPRATVVLRQPPTTTPQVYSTLAPTSRATPSQPGAHQIVVSNEINDAEHPQIICAPTDIRKLHLTSELFGPTPPPPQ